MPIEGGGGGRTKPKPNRKPKPPATPGPGSTDASSSGPNYGVPPGGFPAGGTGGGGVGGDTGSNSGSGGSGNGGSGQGAVDWASILGDYGLPQDIINQLNLIFQQTGDINQAIPIAQAFVRGTSWYKQTYPGIQEGINAGLFNDEQGYRQYTAQVDQIYQQYYGRAATSGEISGYLTSGKSVSAVAAEFQSNATKANFSDPLKALFTDDELTALANEQSGIDTALGQKISAEANLYSQVSLLYQNFYGRDVTRSELDQFNQQGTSAQQVAQNFAVQDNINAMNPAIRDLFTPDEIREAALEQTGAATSNGKSLLSLIDLATQLNPIYHQYTGDGVSRQEIEDAYNSGTSADTIGKQFAGAAYINANKGDIQQTAGSFGDTGQLTPNELTALGQEQAGLDTPLGQQLTTSFNKALQRMQGAFKGVLASPSLSLATGKLAGVNAGNQPDVAA